MPTTAICCDCGKKCQGERCRACFLEQHRSPPATCFKCGKEFRRNSTMNYKRGRPKYCSRDCSFAALRDGERRTGKAKVCLPRLTRRLIAWFDGWENDSIRPGPKTGRCECCKKGFYRKKAKQKYCSTICRNLAPKSEQIARPRVVTCCHCGKKAVKKRKGNHTWACFKCRQQTIRRSRKTQSLKRRGSERFRTRCRKFGGFFNPRCKAQDIYTADRYKCQQCGRTVVHDKTNWNRQDAATVDHHPVPLSRGGDHDWHNVRTCCRRCNTKKGNDWDRQRLLTFGKKLARPIGGGK